MMTQVVTLDIFLVSLIVLLLVVIVLLILCCILRRSKSRNLTELRISGGQSAHVMTIKTKPDHAQQLLDQLLDRFFLQVEPGPETGGEPEVEPGEEVVREHGPDSGSNSAIPTADISLDSKAVPPATQDLTDDLNPQQFDASEHASLSSQDASCSAGSVKEEDQHDEPQP